PEASEDSVAVPEVHKSGASNVPGAVKAAPVAAPEDPLAAETGRLREVHAALRDGDPNRALALLDQSPGGEELSEERGAARIVALCKIGRKDEGRAALVAFVAAHPRSPHVDRVRRACGED